MRIIGGKYRGLRLATLRGDKLRPTSDQLRETLFDVLGGTIENTRFLDLYAGTGAVGLEALSRGALETVFVERHRPAAEIIQHNLAALKIRSGFCVMACAVLPGLERLASQGERFNFVFLDPPYAEFREYHHALRQLGRPGVLTGSSLVIAEHSRQTLLEEGYGNLRRTRTIRHGDAQLSFFRLAAL